MPDSSAALDRKTRRSLWSFAFFRVESALIVAATLLASTLKAQGFIPWLPGSWQLWLGAGFVAEIIIISTTVTDKKLRQHLQQQQLRAQFDVGVFRNKTLQSKVVRTLEYRENMLKAMNRDSILDQKFQGIMHEFEDWIGQVYRLAVQLDRYQSDNVLLLDRQQLPEDIRSLKQRRGQEDNPRVLADLEHALATKTRQMQALESLADTMHSAELKLDSTLAAMSTLYTQTLDLNSKEHEATTASHVQEAMHEQIMSLEDITLAMDDVYHLQRNS